MRIGIVAGICVERDAISAAACEQAKLAAQLPEVESVTLFTTHMSRSSNVPIRVVSEPWALACDPVLRACDVVVFHWGIYSTLFDAVWLLAPRQRVVIHFHNMTPAELVGARGEGVAEQSLRQLHALASLDLEYWTHSDFNHAELIRLGVVPDRIKDVPLLIEPPRELHSRRRDDRLALLCVGRLVAAKAPHVLVEAVDILADGGVPIRLTLAGNRSLSDRSYAKELEQRIRRSPHGKSVMLVQPDAEQLWSMYEEADVVVSTSLHEGLCVPVIEGYLARCHAIGTTAGNLPFVVQPPDPVVAPGDPAALAHALMDVARSLRNPSAEWIGNVKALCDRYSRPAVRTALKAALSGI